ncbi:sensor histidine kinase [Derxia lacustris]|uniref:sensor histidine kinase n=1 Tax=Derxia lacustris TaxID=764842 RepID=UPI000A178055|nr:ATP-binding protein [Derxia lacustris]
MSAAPGARATAACRRWLPRRFNTLAAQLLLLLGAAVLTIQLASFGALLFIRGHETRMQMYAFMAADVDFVREFLRSLPPERRADWLPRLNRGYYRLALLPADAPLAPLAHPDVLESLAIVEARLHTAGDMRPARPVLARLAPDAAPLPGIAIELDGRQQLMLLFDTPPPNSVPPPVDVLGYLGLLLLVIGALALLLARVATRSLGRFAGAAEALSVNLDAPPLAEDGPVEVARAASAFNRMQAAIRRHLDERTQILASVSHDLKTPLTRLRLRAENLPEAAPQRARFIADIEAMDALVSEGLDYARSAQLHEARSPVDLDRLLATLAEDAADTGARVTVTGQLGQAVPAAPRALQRALQNLLDNALRYGDGAADITLERAGAEVRIGVADRGPGLPDELLERVFEPFYRVEGSRSRASGGTGLGLAIARNLMRAQGGDIVLSRRAGGGLLATLRMPAR